MTARQPRAARVTTHSRSLQRLGNLFMIGLLRSPAHRLVSGSLLLLSFRGRRSGRRFTIPVMYAERDGTLTVFVGHPDRKTWWRNLRQGAEVEVRLHGDRLRGQAAVASDAAVARTYLERYPRARAAIRAAEPATFVQITELRPSQAGEVSGNVG
jgi:deazaflavin-dependent oxidoreductase (nitroreductase family)